MNIVVSEYLEHNFNLVQCNFVMKQCKFFDLDFGVTKSVYLPLMLPHYYGDSPYFFPLNHSLVACFFFNSSLDVATILIQLKRALL